MSRFIAATGYESVEGSLWAPPRLTAKIVLNYHICAVTPALAQSDFLSNEELFCGSKVIYGVEQDLDMFSLETDNNEDPETLSGPGIDTASMTICQQQKFEWKISDQDKAMMCDNLPKWEANIRRQISKNIVKLIDAYSIPKIIASASPLQAGHNAGILSRDIDLGSPDDTALPGNTKEGFEEMIISLTDVAYEAGMQCAEGEIPGEGESARPIILIPLVLRRYALAALRDLNVCCGENNVLITGKLADNIYGVRVVVTRYLQAFMTAAGRVAYVVLVDPNRVLHAFEVITNKWWEDKFEDYLVGHFIFDTSVIHPLGVAVAVSQV